MFREYVVVDDLISVIIVYQRSIIFIFFKERQSQLFLLFIYSMIKEKNKVYIYIFFLKVDLQEID